MRDPGLAEHADALAAALEAALPEWIERVAPGIDPAAIVADVVDEIRAFLALDIDDQRTTPLAIVRELAVPRLTEALRALGRPEVPIEERDPFLAERFPADVYALTPSSWADLGESVVEPGIAWGAAKAWTHRRRHSA